MAAPPALAQNSVGEKPVGEKYGVGENRAADSPLAKNQSPEKSKSKHFSPTQFSPTAKREYSPTKTAPKKAKLRLVNPAKNGERGRPRNPELPPSPGKYLYWTKARNGLKLERRKPEYEYIGFIMPNEWQHLRGQYNEEYVLKVITAAIRVKRARAAQNRRTGAGSAR